MYYGEGGAPGAGSSSSGGGVAAATAGAGQSPSGSPSGAASPSGRRAAGTRVEIWRKRWAGAEAVLRREGVALRSWRVGGDAAGECVALVRREMEGLAGR